jgi:Na+:H+ antiporter, NhaA family
MRRIAKAMREFLHAQASGGVVLLIAAILAIFVANSGLAESYNALLQTSFNINLPFLAIFKEMSIKLWIDDGLMAVFFLLVGLELKREIAIGELSSRSRITLPFFAAIGGVLVPVLIFYCININSPQNMPAVAIPMATDIAFAVGVVSLFGNKISNSLRVFLVALAIIDDIIAILVIAIFYSSTVDMGYLGYAAIVTILLFALNRMKVANLTPYLILAPFLWLFILKSGIHATIAGVVLAFFIPIGIRNKRDKSPLQYLEHLLHIPVTHLILPIFAFANSGLVLSNFSVDLLFDGLVLGIVMGLFIGKQVGVISFVYLLHRFKLCPFFKDASKLEFYGISILTGIGFTMSLFIGNLSFADGGQVIDKIRFGVILASLMSGIFGFIILKIATRNKEQNSN